MRTQHFVRRLAPLAAALLLAPGMLAQDADPRQEIKEIAERVSQQLQEIDRMLLESSNARQQRSRPQQLLKQSMQRGTEAQRGIEELIEKLNALKGN